MRWATYRPLNSADEVDRVGLVVDRTVYGLQSASRLADLLGDDGEKLKVAAEQARRSPREVLPLEGVRIRPLLPEPRSIRDFSSFLQHYRASMVALKQPFNDLLLQLPIFYYTCNTNMTGDGDVVSIPGNCEQMDYELEVCCIVGKAGKDLDPVEAEKHIAGYTIMNDWSARDLLSEELKRAPMVAKGKDAGMGLGPFLVTPDELNDARQGKGFNLAMNAWVNGKQYTKSNWSSINWSFGEMLSYASRNVPLLPGDVIAGGTVGEGCLLELGLTYGREKYPWLKPGDEVTIEIERIGKMRNTMKAGKKPIPLQPLAADSK